MLWVQIPPDQCSSFFVWLSQKFLVSLFLKLVPCICHSIIMLQASYPYLSPLMGGTWVMLHIQCTCSYCLVFVLTLLSPCVPLSLPPLQDPPSGLPHPSLLPGVCGALSHPVARVTAPGCRRLQTDVS